jgi:hypothetical protein
MKHAGWIAGGSILVLFVGAWEIAYHLTGNDFVVGVASICIFLVWAAISWRIGKWADNEHKIARELWEAEMRAGKRPPA